MIDDKLKKLFNHRRICVLGAGLEGVAMANFSLSLGAIVEIRDAKSLDQLSAEAKLLAGRTVVFKTGSDYLSGLEKTDLIIRSPGISWLMPELVAARKAGINVTSQTELFLRYTNAKTVGVTGTKGKSTTASLIYYLLKKSGKPVKLAGNLGQTFIEWLFDDLSGQIVVLELSSFQLQGIKTSPNMAVVLDITNEHLDYHKNRKEYILAKQAIVANQTKIDIAVIDADSLTSLQFSYATLANNWWFSSRKSVDNGVYCGRQGDERWFIFNRDGQSEMICPLSKSPLVGEHNNSNVAAALTVAKLLEVSNRSINNNLPGFSGLSHRLESIGKFADRYWIDDGYATAPEATMAAILTVPKDSLIIVGGSSKNIDLTELSKKLIEAKLKAVILVGETGPLIRELILQESTKSAERSVPKLIDGGVSMKEIIEKAIEFSVPGDTILFSPGCASFGMFKNAKDRAEQFVNLVKGLDL